MPPRSGSVALRQLNPIHKKGSKVFFVLLDRRYKIKEKVRTWPKSGRYVCHFKFFRKGDIEYNNSKLASTLNED